MPGYPEALATRSLGELQPLTQLSEARRREANLRKIWDWCLGRGIGLGVSFWMQTSQNAPCATGPVCSNSREAEVQLLCLGRIELFEFAAEIKQVSLRSSQSRHVRNHQHHLWQHHPSSIPASPPCPRQYHLVETSMATVTTTSLSLRNLADLVSPESWIPPSCQQSSRMQNRQQNKHWS